MTIEAIGAAGPLTESLATRFPAAPDKTAQVDFSRLMTDQLSDLNRQIATAERSLVGLAAGDGNLHQVMLDLEKARLGFQLTLQVRNKVLESYQELLRMQI
jgi:flagellar hook-basal body complex protein FliE